MQVLEKESVIKILKTLTNVHAHLCRIAHKCSIISNSKANVNYYQTVHVSRWQNKGQHYLLSSHDSDYCKVGLEMFVGFLFSTLC